MPGRDPVTSRRPREGRNERRENGCGLNARIGFYCTGHPIRIGPRDDAPAEPTPGLETRNRWFTKARQPMQVDAEGPWPRFSRGSSLRKRVDSSRLSSSGSGRSYKRPRTYLPTLWARPCRTRQIIALAPAHAVSLVMTSANTKMVWRPCCRGHAGRADTSSRSARRSRS